MPHTVVHIIDTVEPQPGGVSSVLPGLWQHQRERNWEVTVISRENSQRFESCIAGADLVHVHGLYGQMSRQVWPALKRSRRPYLVSTYAMLMPRPYRTDRWQRLTQDWRYQRSMLRKAFCLHVLTNVESEWVKRKGFHRRVKVLPIGVDEQVTREAPSPTLAATLPAGRTVAYLGPLHPSEGIVPLLRACAMLGDDFEDVHMVLACPAEESLQEPILAAVRRQGFEKRVTVITRPTLGDMKAIIQACALVAAPSLGACCPVAAVQALALGKAVLVSPGCDLPEVQRVGAGWQEECDRKSLIDALSRILRKDRAELERIGDAGLDIVRRRYTWQRLGPEYLNLYARILGGH